MDRAHVEVHGLGPQRWSMDRGSIFKVTVSLASIHNCNMAYSQYNRKV